MGVCSLQRHWIFIHGANKVEVGLMGPFFGLFSVAPLFREIFLPTSLAPSFASIKKLQIAYLTSWHSRVFDYRLRINYEQQKLKILKKLKTASLNSKWYRYTWSKTDVISSVRKHNCALGLGLGLELGLR